MLFLVTHTQEIEINMTESSEVPNYKSSTTIQNISAIFHLKLSHHIQVYEFKSRLKTSVPVPCDKIHSIALTQAMKRRCQHLSLTACHS